ncbi:MAG: ribonuclease catalytic domain-containing protein [Thermodesulfobacteriota bacterium]
MAVAGRIVEYMEQGRFLCAVVAEDEGKRLRIINQNGREVNLPSSRVLHLADKGLAVSASREEQLRQLKETDQRRHQLMEAIDLPAIWQLASEEGQDEGFSPEFLAELAFGEAADDDHVAAFLRGVLVDRLYFKYKEGQVLAHPPEVVEQLLAKREQEREQEALMASGAEGLRRIWDDGDGGAEWPGRERCLELVRDYAVHEAEAAEAQLTRELLKRAGLNGSRDPYQLLVKAGVWQEHQNVALERYAIPVAFGESLLAETRLPEPEADALLAQGRRDFRALPLLTIDGDETRDLDDALHLEQRGTDFLVGIHISDVAHYVKPGDSLYDEASRRMTSLYFPDARIPMLPEALSEGVCSLVAGRPRAAVSVMVLLSARGEVKEYEIVESVVSVGQRLSYAEADRRVGASDPELGGLFRLSEQLKQRRIEAGALLLPVPDVNIAVDAEGQVSVSLAPVDTPGRSLVAEFMVLANTLAAEFVAVRQAPGLFRCQDEPHQRLAGGTEKDLFAVMRQRRQLKPGELLVHPKPHSGVGVMQYTTVTSPIRRFLDLVMQHQIKHLLAGRGPLFSADALAGVAGDINTILARVNQVRRLRHRYWLLRYLEPKTGSRMRALVVNRGPKRVNLILLDCLLDVDMPPTQAVRPGDVVMVRIAKVEPLDNLLRVEW